MSNAAGFIVIAEFHIKPDEVNAFLALAHEDSAQSLANEPGCHQFDVLTSDSDETLVVLHEAYTDRAAFDAHMQMPHYAPFKESSAPLLTGEPFVRFFQVNIVV
ncbi:MAG: putative quinol monooxygenase [Salinisphaera sp.]|jgi:autoinducer 2-degrading protein|nr:putative quinol monooxygenase [Salinisphaera sp.]